MSRYINENGTFNHAKWMRDRVLNEGPENDPALKALRLKKKGELMPNISQWWEYDPDDIMRFVYWGKGQMPPTDQKVRSQSASKAERKSLKYAEKRKMSPRKMSAKPVTALKGKTPQKSIDNSFIKAIFKSRWVFSIIFAASATFMLGAL